jgi:hypothetical protein
VQPCDWVCCRSLQQLQQAVSSVRQQQEQLQQHPWEELRQVRGCSPAGPCRALLVAVTAAASVIGLQTVSQNIARLRANRRLNGQSNSDRNKMTNRTTINCTSRHRFAWLTGINCQPLWAAGSGVDTMHSLNCGLHTRFCSSCCSVTQIFAADKVGCTGPWVYLVADIVFTALVSSVRCFAGWVRPSSGLATLGLRNSACIIHLDAATGNCWRGVAAAISTCSSPCRAQNSIQHTAYSIQHTAYSIQPAGRQIGKACQTRLG